MRGCVADRGPSLGVYNPFMAFICVYGKFGGMMDPMALLTLVQSGLMLDSGLDGASIVDTVPYITTPRKVKSH